MSHNPRQIIADVAREYLGTRETSKNRGPHLEQFWAATSYPDGATNREPWCSAFVTFCVREGDKRSPDIALRNPPVFPAVAQWRPWARNPRNGCLTFTAADVRAGKFQPEAGDIFDLLPSVSHIGIVAQDYDSGADVHTIEGNTNDAGSREGDGIYLKTRKLAGIGIFIRIPAAAKAA
jgi:hypothetical protein